MDTHVDGCIPNLEQSMNIIIDTGIDDPSLLSILSPLQSLQSLPHLDPNHVESFLNNFANENCLHNGSDKVSNVGFNLPSNSSFNSSSSQLSSDHHQERYSHRYEHNRAFSGHQIKEFSQAIDAYFTSVHENETESLPIQAPSTTFQSSSCSPCCNPCNSCCLSSSSHFNPNHQPQSSSFDPDFFNESTFCAKFKSKLTLTNDVSKVQKPWISCVAKQILSAYYSPLSLKSEFMSNQTVLDAFESLAVQEVVQAFKEISFNNPNVDINLAMNNFFANPSATEVVSGCEKLRSYRKLTTDDKVTLLTNGFFDFNTIKKVFIYDPVIDGWHYTGKIWTRKSFYKTYPTLVARINYFIENFPNYLRNDLTAVALLYAIILFNPDLQKLKFQTTVRQERYTYIYLLKRYLSTHFGSKCEALENLYCLMVRAEEIAKTRLETIQFFDSYQSGCSKTLKKRVAHLVQFKEF